MIVESDAELVEQALNSDDGAFSDLIARYQGRIYAIIISNVRNFADAQDLTQNVFLTAYMRLKSLRKPGSFGPWIRKIAVNQCRIYGIQRKRIDQTEEAYGEIPAESANQVKREPDQADLWVALSQLPDDQRTVLTLFHLEKQSYQEISDFLEITKTTVQTRLRYARQALKKEMISLMENELKSNRLPEGFSEDTVKAARELADLLMGSVPAELMNFIRQPNVDRNRTRSQIFKAFYESLTSEQKEAFQDENRRLDFADLTIDQQVYLRQALHQMWMWGIADAIVHPPFYIQGMETMKLTLDGDPDGFADIGIGQKLTSPDGWNRIVFGVEFGADD